MKETTCLSGVYFFIAIAAIVPSSTFSYACQFNYYGDIL